MLNRILFLTGLILLVAGQVLLARGNEFVYALRPIDFAHWSLLVGVVLMIPQVVTFPRKGLNYVGIPLTITGIVCIIGMCVLDFIWWSQPTQDIRNEFAAHISQVPSIWQPFIAVGSSSKVFNLGLLLIALGHYRKSRWGVLLVLLATLVLMHIIPFWYRLVTGYILTFLGFGLIFLEDFKPINHLDKRPDHTMDA
ncbi:hypothetical protein [Robiginitalea sediminis]|uniref:hypothetical protein n=1 Tax=Robiginitalea sediminis TaxID=1982593 RepID=UPI001179AE9F|nr:hypothetical protein [Robiginitalea sediminis]